MIVLQQKAEPRVGIIGQYQIVMGHGFMGEQNKDSIVKLFTVNTQI